MDTQAWWYLNGSWVHPQEATISLNDVAVLRGYSVFEALRTYKRRPFYLEEHLTRLFRSAQLIDMEIPYSREFLVQTVHAAIERNSYTHASVRMLVTGGISEDGVMPSDEPGLAIMVTPLPERDMQRFAQGIKVITTRHLRSTPEAKTANYTSAIRALKTARQRGASDALYVNEREQVLESTRGNFFVLRNATLITPSAEVLHGITREVVLSLARDYCQVEERPIQLAELSEIDEAFITSSSREIMPVTQIDDQTIGSGQPGPHTYALEQRFIALVESQNW